MRPRRVGVCPWMCVGMRGVHAYVRERSARRGTYIMCVLCMHVACAREHEHVHVHVRASKCACTRNGLEVSMSEPRAPYCIEVNAVLAPPRPLPLPLPVRGSGLVRMRVGDG